VSFTHSMCLTDMCCTVTMKDFLNTLLFTLKLGDPNCFWLPCEAHTSLAQQSYTHMVSCRVCIV